MQNITPPPFFLSLPGDPPIPWSKWKKVFLTYIRVCGSNLSADRKTSILQHCLGAEGQEILENLPVIDSPDGAEGDTNLNEFELTLLRLDRHYLPKVSIILQRYYFGKCKQSETETVEDFVTALRKLAAQCEVGDTLEERIRDQFMLECKSDKIREALWSKGDPNCDEVIMVAKQIEHSELCMENLRKSKNALRDIQLVETKVATKKPTGTLKSKLLCYRCNSSSHLTNSKDCPAINMLCKKFGKRGHFARCCKSSEKKMVKVNEIEYACSDEEEEKSFVLQVVNDVNCIARVNCDYPIDEVDVNGIKVSMMMDSGAKTVLPGMWGLEAVKEGAEQERLGSFIIQDLNK
ncbi:hypothetical protein NDU88_002896 [Pleurodeles waltl]|uniref:Uncharacterized protein n=1 Tax=Pleurodeles waltl TaxID=8319 RepID=A0AAV7UWX3_PLEWA|nr:hypothetical protein NDU88_002896 [Pleurodeles waltl]